MQLLPPVPSRYSRSPPPRFFLRPPETPAAAGFLTPAPGAATSAPTLDAVAKAKMPSEITGKTVEDIIHSWNAELARPRRRRHRRLPLFRPPFPPPSLLGEPSPNSSCPEPKRKQVKQTTAFGTYARSLSEWDRHIFRNRRTLLAMEEEMARVSSAQEALVRQLNVLEVHQQEVHETLEARSSLRPRTPDASRLRAPSLARFLPALPSPCARESAATVTPPQGMENELERLYSEEAQHLDDSAADRDQLFAAAEEVAAQLAEMGANLAQAIDLVNGAEQRSQGAADPLASAMRILNNQLVTLQALDKKAQVLGRRVEQCDV